ncbi:Oidioi.mRNA.OKI2018_I69.chr1.g215.t1.cds [Oikopleura dioica]|uniref:Oidioi.mRNA.OKI2018_I69.chr1.g215.t1.cds n=1 Tax=Oikopleura dioica TaxID=34765 RepID=A0ABN7SJ60_OIKDI|nr:Oidioi.mRNA.OKI2018_I69.chr1.g215.t1.cds [Oikopleura dioica]
MNRNGGHQHSRNNRRSNGGPNGNGGPSPSKWQEFRASHQNPEHEMNEGRKPNFVPESVDFIPGQRMFGTVEKMMNSYGFIDVLDRKGRVFFHFSQYKNGGNEPLRVHDEVEFEMMIDDRNSRVVASKVVRLPRGTIEYETLSPERICGYVAAPPTRAHPGSLTYSTGGEYFFIPFFYNDVVPETPLFKNDEVSFFISTNKRTKSLSAKKVTVVARSQAPKRFRGRVSGMKDSFGFIKRAEVAVEIFFHYSQVAADVPDLRVGNDVEFSIENRKDKEVAVNVTLLPDGSVVFDDISEKILSGRLLTIPTNKRDEGKIECTSDGKIYAFAEADRDGNAYTVQENDIVRFLIATDRRDHSKRAVSIQLDIDATKAEKNEERETGIVAAVKVLEGFGFIKCQSRENRMFFHCSEIIDAQHRVKMSDEVEFTVMPDTMVNSKPRLHATRIKILPKGSVHFSTLSNQLYNGVICGEKSIKSDAFPDLVEMEEALDDLAEGESVAFRIRENKRTDERIAVEVRSLKRDLRYGTVILKKDSYGFIESEDHCKEIFFHYSEIVSESDQITLGSTVEYSENLKDNKLCAVGIKISKKDLSADEDVSQQVLSGIVKQELKSSNQSYGGVIDITEAEGTTELSSVRFSSTSMAEKRTFNQNDPVCFQLATHKKTGDIRAVNVQLKRKQQQSTIESIKGEYGFINYQEGEGDSKNVFFHATNLIDVAIADLGVGDVVKFSVIHNKRSGNTCAAGIRLIKKAPKTEITAKEPVSKDSPARPERLKMKLSRNSESKEDSPVIRQPKGPEAAGVKGFGRQMSRSTTEENGTGEPDSVAEMETLETEEVVSCEIEAAAVSEE